MTTNPSHPDFSGNETPNLMARKACESFLNVDSAIKTLIEKTNYGIMCIEVDKVKKTYATKNAYELTDTI